MSGNGDRRAFREEGLVGFGMVTRDSVGFLDQPQSITELRVACGDCACSFLFSTLTLSSYSFPLRRRLRSMR